MLDRLNVAIDQARAHPQNGPVKKFLLDLFNSLDAVRALAKGADDEIRQHPSVREGLRGAREVLGHMQAVVARYKTQLPVPVAQQLEEQFRTAERSLGDFSNDSSAAWRAGVLAAVRAINTFVFLGVPLAEGQKKTTALYVGSAAKSALRAAGLAARPTTHTHQVKDHFIGRDLINTQQSLLFALGLIPMLMKEGPAKDKLHAVTHGNPYLACVGVASVIGAAVAFHHREISGALNKLFYGHSQPNLKGEETFGDVAVRRLRELGRALYTTNEERSANGTVDKPWKRQQHDMDAIAPDVRQALEHVFDVSGLASKGMSHLRTEMAKIGPLSDSSNKTAGQVEGAFDSLHKAMAVVLGEPEPAGRANSDFAGKAFLAGLALAACVAPVYFLKDNAIGFVDLAANAAFVFLIMAMNTAQQSTSLQTSEDDFGQFCGFSMAMIPVWAYNLSKGDPMEHGWGDAMKGAAVLTVLGNLAAAPFGKAAGSMAGKVAGVLGGESPEQQDVEATSSDEARESRIRELPDDDSGNSPRAASGISAAEPEVASQSSPPTVDSDLDLGGNLQEEFGRALAERSSDRTSS